MLIISRKLGESFFIGDDIEICLLEAQNDKIKIGISAPKSVKIMRKELLETKKTNRQAAQTANEIDTSAFNEILMRENFQKD